MRNSSPEPIANSLSLLWVLPLRHRLIVSPLQNLAIQRVVLRPAAGDSAAVQQMRAASAIGS
jgi:hypothetical protein